MATGDLTAFSTQWTSGKWHCHPLRWGGEGWAVRLSAGVSRLGPCVQRVTDRPKFIMQCEVHSIQNRAMQRGCISYGIIIQGLDCSEN